MGTHSNEHATKAVPCEPFQGPTGVGIAVTVAIGTLALYYLRYLVERRDGRELRSLRVFTLDVSKIVLGSTVAWAVLILFSHVAAVPFTPADTIVHVPSLPRGLNSTMIAALLAKARGVGGGDGTGANVDLGPSTHQFDVATQSHRLEPIAWYPSALIAESTLGTALGLAFAAAFRRLCRRTVAAARDVVAADYDGDAETVRRGSACAWWVDAWVRFSRANSVSGKYGPGYVPPTRIPSWAHESFARHQADDGDDDDGGSALHTAHRHQQHRRKGDAASGTWSAYLHVLWDLARGHGVEATKQHEMAIRGGRSGSVLSAAAAEDGTGEAEDDRLRMSWFWAQTAAWCACVAASRLITAFLLLLFIRWCPPSLSPVVALARWVQALPFSCAEKQVMCFGGFRLFVDVVVLAITDDATKFKQGASSTTGSGVADEA